MLLSIIIPTYNSELVIEKTLESIVRQTHHRDEFEVIIVDGLSYDTTLDKVKKYSGIKLKIIIEKDHGIYDAMNKGIKYSEGKYCYFIGAGDVLSEDVFDIIFPTLRECDGLVYGNVIRTKGNVVYDGRFNPIKLFRRNICHQAIFYPSREIKKYYYNLRYKVLADYNLNLLIFSNRKLPRVYIPDIIAYYDDLSQGFSSKNIDDNFINDFYDIVMKNYSVGYRIAFMFIHLIRKIKKVIR
ncbi:glycosyltransferase [Edwardsiella tarda]|uniref:glycosyltransferase n=1 Tax=Edwardsiella tarda TaxID=636 RepID=UPI000D51113F|nr:glycosyltransferase [Edwardsiella tarda]UCQ10403.1 glycosyltransferase [Edwardsiella tarda]